MLPWPPTGVHTPSGLERRRYRGIREERKEEIRRVRSVEKLEVESVSQSVLTIHSDRE